MSSSGIHEYRIIEKMAAGSFGVVFKVERKKDLKLFVMKRIPLENLDRAERHDAVKEFYVMKELCHPFIAHQYDAFLFNDNDLCLIMEFYDGGDMDRAISARRDEDDEYFPFRRVMLWFSEMLLAVHYLHSKGIIHRDLKTHNIFFDEDRDHLAVGDFGIAEKIEPNAVQNWMMSMEHSSDNVDFTSLQGDQAGELFSSLAAAAAAAASSGGGLGRHGTPPPLMGVKGELVTMVQPGGGSTTMVSESNANQKRPSLSLQGEDGHETEAPCPGDTSSSIAGAGVGAGGTGFSSPPQSPSSLSGSAGLSHPNHGLQSPMLRSSLQPQEVSIPALMKGTPLYMSPEMLQGAAGSGGGMGGVVGSAGLSAPMVNASTPTARSPLFRRQQPNHHHDSTSNVHNNIMNSNTTEGSVTPQPANLTNGTANALMGQKSDVWSLGCILYELLSLRHPFYSKDMALLVLRVTRGERAPLPSHYPQEVRDLVDRLLSLQPEQRPSCKEILRMPLVSAFTMEMLEERGGVLRAGATNSAEVIDMEPSRNGRDSDDDVDDDHHDDHDDNDNKNDEEMDAGEAVYAAFVKDIEEEEESSVVRRAGTAYRNRHRGTRALLKQLRRLKLEANPSLLEACVKEVEDKLSKAKLARPSQYLAEAEHFNESVNAKLRAANLQLGSISGSFVPLSENNSVFPPTGGGGNTVAQHEASTHHPSMSMPGAPDGHGHGDHDHGNENEDGPRTSPLLGGAAHHERRESEDDSSTAAGTIGGGGEAHSSRQSHSSFLPRLSSMERRGRQGTAAGAGAAHHFPISTSRASFSILETGGAAGGHVFGGGVNGGRRSGSGFDLLPSSAGGGGGGGGGDRLRLLAGQSLNSAIMVTPGSAAGGGITPPATDSSVGTAAATVGPTLVIELLYRHLQDPSSTPCPAFWSEQPLDNVADMVDAPMETLAKEVDTMRRLLAAIYRQRALQRGTLELLHRYQNPNAPLPSGTGGEADEAAVAGAGGGRGVLPCTTGKTGAGPLSYSVLLPSSSSSINAAGVELVSREERSGAQLLAVQRGLIEETDEVSRMLANELEELVRPAHYPNVHRTPIAARYRAAIAAEATQEEETNEEQDEEDWEKIMQHLPPALLPYVQKRRDLYDYLFPMTKKRLQRQRRQQRRRQQNEQPLGDEDDEDDEDQEEGEEGEDARSTTFLTSANTSAVSDRRGAAAINSHSAAVSTTPPFTREEFENVYVYYADHDLLRRDPQRVRRMVPQRRKWQYLPVVDTIVRLDRFLRKAQGMQ